MCGCCARRVSGAGLALRPGASPWIAEPQLGKAPPAHKRFRHRNHRLKSVSSMQNRLEAGWAAALAASVRVPALHPTGFQPAGQTGISPGSPSPSSASATGVRRTGQKPLPVALPCCPVRRTPGNATPGPASATVPTPGCRAAPQPASSRFPLSAAGFEPAVRGRRRRKPPPAPDRRTPARQAPGKAAPGRASIPVPHPL